MIINAKNEKFQFYWNQLYNDFPEAPPHFQLSIMKFIGQRPIDENYKTENLSFIVFDDIQDKPVAGVYIFLVEKDKNINVLGYEIAGLILEKNSITRKLKKLFISEFNKIVEKSNDKVIFNDCLEHGNLSSLSMSLLANNAHAEPEVIGIIDLSKSEDILKRNIRKRYKSLINRGNELMNIIIFNDHNINTKVLEEFRQLHISESGREMRSKKAWHKLNDVIKNKNGFVICGFQNEEMISAGCFIYNSNACYYLLSASKRSMFDQPLFHPIIWEAILYAKKIGCINFQIGKKIYRNFPNNHGVSDKEIDITTFKNGFGGKNKMYLKVTVNRKDNFV